MRKALLGMLAVSVSIVGVVAIAQAHTKRFPTSLSATARETGGGLQFRGSVGSRRRPCRARVIAIIRVSPNGPKRIRRTRSNAAGSWSVNINGASAGATYRARALRKRLRPKTRRHHHICRPKASAVTIRSRDRDRDKRK